MGLLLAVPLTAFIKLVADFVSILNVNVSNMLALTPRPTPRWVRYGETALERAIPSLRPRPGKKSLQGANPGRPRTDESIAAIAWPSFLGGDPVCNLVILRLRHDAARHHFAGFAIRTPCNHSVCFCSSHAR